MSAFNTKQHSQPKGIRMDKAETAAEKTVQELLRAWFRRTFPVRLEGSSYIAARIEALIKGLPPELPVSKLTPNLVTQYTVSQRSQLCSPTETIVDEVMILKLLVLGEKPSPGWTQRRLYVVDVNGYLPCAPTISSQAVL